MTNKLVEGAELLRGITNESSKAFEQFYDNYSPLVYGIALKMLGNPGDAEDLCHDVFLEIHRNATSYDSKKGSVEAWLAVKTKSRCLDRLRKKKYKLIYGEERMESIPGYEMVENQVMATLEKEVLMEAMKKLPKSQQEAIYRNYFGELTQREISKTCKLPLGTVKSQIRYGIHNLKKILREGTSLRKARSENK